MKTASPKRSRLSDTPNNGSHDRSPSPPTPLPQAGEGRFLSRWRDFHRKVLRRAVRKVVQVFFLIGQVFMPSSE